MAVSIIPTPRNNSNTTFAGSFKTENIPITREQGTLLRAGADPTALLGAAVAPPVSPALQSVTTSSSRATATPPIPPSPQALAVLGAGGDTSIPFQSEQLDPSGLRRVNGQYMYGGPEGQLVPLPWRDPTNVGPAVPLPATPQPPPTVQLPGGRQDIPITNEQEQRLRAGEDPGAVLNQTPVTPGPPAPTPVNRAQDIPITPEQSRRLRAGEDPAVVLGQPPTPAAPMPAGGTEDIPITPEQVRRLRAGEDPGTVLGSNILPQVSPGTPLPPSMTPESIGPPNMTPSGQLNNPPWTPLMSGFIPDNMGHVVTDARLMELLQPMIPDPAWVSDIIRAGRYAHIEPRFV